MIFKKENSTKDHSSISKSKNENQKKNQCNLNHVDEFLFISSCVSL